MLYAIVSAYASMPKHWWCSTVDLCTLQELWWIMKSSCKYSGWSGRRGTSNGSQNFKHVVLAFWIFWQLPRWSKVAKCGQGTLPTDFLARASRCPPTWPANFKPTALHRKSQKQSWTSVVYGPLWASMDIYGRLVWFDHIWSVGRWTAAPCLHSIGKSEKLFLVLGGKPQDISIHLKTMNQQVSPTASSETLRLRGITGVEHKTKAHTNP